MACQQVHSDVQNDGQMPLPHTVADCVLDRARLLDNLQTVLRPEQTAPCIGIITAGCCKSGHQVGEHTIRQQPTPTGQDM